MAQFHGGAYSRFLHPTKRVIVLVISAGLRDKLSVMKSNLMVSVWEALVGRLRLALDEKASPYRDLGTRAVHSGGGHSYKEIGH